MAHHQDILLAIEESGKETLCLPTFLCCSWNSGLSMGSCLTIRKGDIKTMKRDDGISVSHILFADDMLVFSKGIGLLKPLNNS